MRASLEKIIPTEWRDKIVTKMRALNTRPKPAMAEAVRSSLMAEFREENLALESILGRKVPWAEN